MSITIKMTNTHHEKTATVTCFDNGNLAGDSIKVAPGQSVDVYVTPSRKIVLTEVGGEVLAGVPLHTVPAGEPPPVPGPDDAPGGNKSNTPPQY